MMWVWILAAPSYAEGFPILWPPDSSAVNLGGGPLCSASPSNSRLGPLHACPTGDKRRC
ncbi:hypothetical protein M758_UG000300 [Ceratodon purpureus]|nr:hypothetical protein M758_UG000300 [Ceratodon purpureus]